MVGKQSGSHPHELTFQLFVMKAFLICCSVLLNHLVQAQLYIAPGDSLSVLPGTLFTLQEHLENYGRIYNGGILTLNGTTTQLLTGNGTTDNLTADNNAQMTTDTRILQSLLLSAGKTFDINNRQLTVQGNINGPGWLKGSPNSSLVLDGSGSSTIQADPSLPSSSNAFKTMTVSGTSTQLSLQNKMFLYDALLPTGGSLLLNDQLVLRSNASGTARVGVVGSSIQYGTSGKFVVERYVPGRRAWRLLTAPISASSQLTIHDAWQDGAPRVTNVGIINSTNNPNPGFGTHVTNGLPAINGYDQGVNGNTSIRYLNSTGWNGVPTATNDGGTLNSGFINDQPGYMLFVRGDRGTLLSQATGAATSPTVLRPSGKINVGSISHPLTASFNDGAGSVFRVIGNPYATPLGFHQMISNPTNVASGFADAFYLWDPNITGTNGVGGFVGLSYNAAASAVAGVPVYDRSTVAAGGGVSGIDNQGNIPSGSAFLIDYNGGATTLQIEENNKSVAAGAGFFRTTHQISTQLCAVNADSSISVNDGVLVSFDEQYNAQIDRSDLKKLPNFAENMAISSHGSLLCIERRKPVAAGDTLLFQLTKLRLKKYFLELVCNEVPMPNGTAPFLVDRFLQQEKPVQLSDTTRYFFQVNNQTGSYDTGRLFLVFRNINRFEQFEAERQQEDVVLHWRMADTFGIAHYDIEVATDGIHFHQLARTIFNSGLHQQPPAGQYDYRIKCTNVYGVVSYSNIRRVIIPSASSEWVLFPNPIVDKKVWLKKGSAPAGNYRVQLTDASGKKVHDQLYHHAGGSLLQSINIPSSLSNGWYQLSVWFQDAQVVSFSCLVNLQ